MGHLFLTGSLHKFCSFNLPPLIKPSSCLQGGRGLHETLKLHSKKFVGILNGIDTDAWNPSTDDFLTVQYNADDLQGKKKNKDAIKKYLKLSSTDPFQPLVTSVLS